MKNLTRSIINHIVNDLSITFVEQFQIKELEFEYDSHILNVPIYSSKMSVLKDNTTKIFKILVCQLTLPNEQYTREYIICQFDDSVVWALSNDILTFNLFPAAPGTCCTVKQQASFLLSWEQAIEYGYTFYPNEPDPILLDKFEKFIQSMDS